MDIAPHESPPDLSYVLKQRFGFSSFLQGQEETIRYALNGHDSIVVMPTGKGKSLCYQLTALFLEGVTIVVSPLIALMKDQVDGLLSRGLSATFVNSSLSGMEMEQRTRELKKGLYKFVYVAPERFRSQRFMEILRRLNVTLLVVDEAHCISHWGHDFRPDYLRLKPILAEFSSARVMALTATATSFVRNDILRLLGLGEEGRSRPQILVYGFKRPNLHLVVSRMATHKMKLGRVVEVINRLKSGIIYCATRKQTERVYSLLQKSGKTPGLYHAGRSDRDRQEIQDQFMRKEIAVVVATNAFGMGVDRSDLRFVIHWDVPGSIEAYYQEIGRAGRDGAEALCELFYNYADVRTQEFFLSGSNPEVLLVEKIWSVLQGSGFRGNQIRSLSDWSQIVSPKSSELLVRTVFSLLERSGFIRQEWMGGGKISISILDDGSWPVLERQLCYLEEKWQRDREKLGGMLRYVNTSGCRHAYILSYFGDQDTAIECTNCDRCTSFSRQETREPTSEEWMILQKTLSCVTRMRGRFGLARIVQVLTGSRAQEVVCRGLDRLSSYGLLKNHGQSYVRTLLEELIQEGAVQVSSGEYPVVSITPRGRQLMFRRDSVSLCWPIPPQQARGTKVASYAMPTLSYDGVIFNRLRFWRADRARKIKAPAFTILHDSTLKILATNRPRILSELENIKGLGPAKIARYGDELLEIVKS